MDRRRKNSSSSKQPGKVKRRALSPISINPSSSNRQAALPSPRMDDTYLKNLYCLPSAVMQSFSNFFSSSPSPNSTTDDLIPSLQLRMPKRAPPPGGWQSIEVTETWAETRAYNTQDMRRRFPNSPTNREALIAHGSLCPLHHFGFRSRACNCPNPGESIFAHFFPEEAFQDFELYFKIFTEKVEPIQRRYLIAQLKKEWGKAFASKYPGWQDTPDTYPDGYLLALRAYQRSVLRDDFAARRMPTGVFDFTANYDSTVFGRGEITNKFKISDLARPIIESAKNSDPVKAEELKNLKCGANCACANGGSGEFCPCMNFAIKERLRAYFDRKGVFRVGNGLTTLGLDSGPTALTDIEGSNIPVVGCSAACGCGPDCHQKKVDKGSRYAEMINVDAGIGLDLRCGEDTPRGMISSLMSGTFIHASESKKHDKKMFVKGMTKNKSIYFTADDYKNNFCLSAHQCSPSMLVVDCYIDRVYEMRRPLAITRRALNAGERKAWNYTNGNEIIEFTCTCGEPNCIHG